MSNPVPVGSPRKSAAIIPFVNKTLTSGLPIGSGRNWLLKDVLPGLARLAVLGNSLNPLNRVNLDIARRAAAKLSVAIETFEVENSQGVAKVLAALAENH